MAEQPLSAASLAQQLRQVPGDYPLPWRMQVRSICASTELELDRWLQRESIGAAARVVVATARALAMASRAAFGPLPLEASG